MSKEDEGFEFEFDDDLDFGWEGEWKNMPEFVQEKQEPYSKLIVRFKTKEDLEEFAKLIEQEINSKTQSIWFPKLKWQDHYSKRWIDEE